MKPLGNTNVRALWRMARMWRRYRGYEHGRPGGIAVNHVDACEASMIMPVVHSNPDPLVVRHDQRQQLAFFETIQEQITGER